MTRLRSQSLGVPSSSGWDSDPRLELRPSDPRPGPIPPSCVMLAEALDSSRGVGGQWSRRSLQGPQEPKEAHRVKHAHDGGGTEVGQGESGEPGPSLPSRILTAALPLWVRRDPTPPPATPRSQLVLVTQLCLALFNPMDCSPPVHGILQAGILEWVAIPFSRGSSRPKD